jgi:hypothetical protein
LVATRATINKPTMKNTPTLLAILMAIAMHRYYTVHIAWWKRSRAFLKATKRRHRASTCSDIINRTCLPLILGVYFIIKSLKKGSSWPNNNRGMAHQYDDKHLSKMVGLIIVGGVNVAFNRYMTWLPLCVINQ